MAMKRVHRLVKKVNKSVKATDMLIEKAGKKLVTVIVLPGGVLHF